MDIIAVVAVIIAAVFVVDFVDVVCFHHHPPPNQLGPPRCNFQEALKDVHTCTCSLCCPGVGFIIVPPQRFGAP